jgi:hypothetical protein
MPDNDRAEIAWREVEPDAGDELGRRQWLGFSAQDDYVTHVTWLPGLRVFVWEVAERKGRGRSLEEAQERCGRVVRLLLEIDDIQELP